LLLAGLLLLPLELQLLIVLLIILQLLLLLEVLSLLLPVELLVLLLGASTDACLAAGDAVAATTTVVVAAAGARMDLPWEVLRYSVNVFPAGQEERGYGIKSVQKIQ
jgi:hypothetical protein